MLAYPQRDKKCEEDVVVGGGEGVQVNGFIYRLQTLEFLFFREELVFC